jgi:hypothetical protein
MSSRLGANPLTSSIFSKTSPEELKAEEEELKKFEPLKEVETGKQNPENGTPKQEDLKQKVEPVIQQAESGNQKEYSVEKIHSFASSEVVYDKVTVRLPLELNDWLDEMVRKTKRSNGSKIKKEVFIQIALEALKEKEIDWTSIKDEHDLKRVLV